MNASPCTPEPTPFTVKSPPFRTSTAKSPPFRTDADLHSRRPHPRAQNRVPEVDWGAPNVLFECCGRCRTLIEREREREREGARAGGAEGIRKRRKALWLMHKPLSFLFSRRGASASRLSEMGVRIARAHKHTPSPSGVYCRSQPGGSRGPAAACATGGGGGGFVGSAGGGGTGAGGVALEVMGEGIRFGGPARVVVCVGRYKLSGAKFRV